MLLQQTLKTDYSLLIQIETRYAHIPMGFCMNIVLFCLFSFISECIIHVLYLLCCVLSAYLSGRRALWNIIYRASVYCTPKRNDRPLAEDLSESRLFHLWDSRLNENMLGEAQFITVAPHRKILHHQHWDYKQPALSAAFLLFALWIQIQTFGLTAARRYGTTSVMQPASVRGNSRWLLIMAAVSWQVV